MLPCRATTGAPSLWFNDPSAIALLAAGGLLFVKPHSAFLLQISLIALRFSQLVQCMVPVFLFCYCFFLVSCYRCVLCPRPPTSSSVLSSDVLGIYFLHSLVFLSSCNSLPRQHELWRWCACAHTHNLPQASFLPDLVHGHVYVLCAFSLQRPGRTINKYILTGPGCNLRLGTLGAFRRCTAAPSSSGHIQAR